MWNPQTSPYIVCLAGLIFSGEIAISPLTVGLRCQQRAWKTITLCVEKKRPLINEVNEQPPKILILPNLPKNFTGKGRNTFLPRRKPTLVIKIITSCLIWFMQNLVKTYWGSKDMRPRYGNLTFHFDIFRLYFKNYNTIIYIET